MDNEKRPADPPATPKPVEHDPGPMQNGIPDGAREADAKALPNNDRQDTETAAKSD